MLTFCVSCGIVNLHFLAATAREAIIVEEKYGKKFGEAKTLPLAVSGLLMVACVLIVAGAAVLGYGLSKGSFKVVSVPLLLAGILLFVHCVKTILGKVVCYENAIVIKQAYKSIELPRERIAAIFWERPGANASNDKVRTNVNVADIIMVGGHEHYKISDGYYSNVEVLGLYQNEYKIPSEIKR